MTIMDENSVVDVPPPLRDSRKKNVMVCIHIVLLSYFIATLFNIIVLGRDKYFYWSKNKNTIDISILHNNICKKNAEFRKAESWLCDNGILVPNCIIISVVFSLVVFIAFAAIKVRDYKFDLEPNDPILRYITRISAFCSFFIFPVQILGCLMAFSFLTISIDPDVLTFGMLVFATIILVVGCCFAVFVGLKHRHFMEEFGSETMFSLNFFKPPSMRQSMCIKPIVEKNRTLLVKKENHETGSWKVE